MRVLTKTAEGAYRLLVTFRRYRDDVKLGVNIDTGSSRMDDFQLSG